MSRFTMRCSFRFRATASAALLLSATALGACSHELETELSDIRIGVGAPPPCEGDSVTAAAGEPIVQDAEECGPSEFE